MSDPLGEFMRDLWIKQPDTPEQKKTKITTEKSRRKHITLAAPDDEVMRFVRARK